MNDIYHCFQAVWDIKTWKIYGYEALIRHDDYHSVNDLILKAQQHNALFDLDLLSISKAIQVHTSFAPSYLFLNIHPSTILHPDFENRVESYMRMHHLIPTKFILELTEGDLLSTWENSNFIKRINWLKELGFKIALDDVGQGTASLKRLIEIKPDVVKVDRFFSRNLSEDEHKQSLLRSIRNYCKEYELLFIIEGIERAEDLSMAKFLKIDYAQGYLLQEPQCIKNTMIGQCVKRRGLRYEEEAW
ncbi:EAL domain-containing protein [Pseudalkalibacillus hwajinpoensis]|uniref:EAL domain-containing protein n=1 Tax=Guptibacillus hwajinpoensis TaxID=208199 RepID=UPI001CD41C86|nr:EAL domain-containing protein [Pseudalkalibacillus hwajinpoensis]MCA0991451.1 EAL domain-containing protein [Pseudalkalibacillus hwajinpoensis]